MSLTLQFDPNVKPRGTFSTIVKEYKLFNKHITFSYSNKSYTGHIIHIYKYGKNDKYVIEYNNKNFPSTTAWGVHILQEIFDNCLANNLSCSMKKKT